ncbi:MULTISPECIES: hypothetical protein [Haloferax]|uniref:Uncharacterized protein n=1 Tax=Haloferax marinum TaxID=2666143 RepID=A0A6A8G6V1_9EURY|nr:MULTISPECIES: hypothetical protein [Haloferax]KAB1197307.1 hypothetical protein Hfx1150_07190 [Haloferax sp. CBA1150]MRW96348.1 hypothetical protein [Haloferax marinum]
MSAARFTGVLRWARRFWSGFTSNRLLGTVTVTAVTWNSLPTFTSVPILGVLARGLAEIQSALPSSGISFGLSVLLLAILIASYLPRIYLDVFAAPVRDHLRVQAVLSGHAFVTAVVAYALFLSTAYNGLPFGLTGVPSWTLSAVAFAGIPVVLLTLQSVESRSLENPDNYFTRPLVFLSGDENPREATREGFEPYQNDTRMNQLVSLFVPIAGATAYTFPATFFGAFAGALNLYYPVLESVAFVGIVGTWVLQSERTPAPESRLGAGLKSATAVDTGFYRQIQTATNPKAWGAFGLLFFGVLLSVIPLLLGSSFHTPIDAFAPDTLLAAYRDVFRLHTLEAAGYAGEKTGDFVVWVGLTVTPFLVVCYGLWYWYHTARRLPSMLYEGGESQFSQKFTARARHPPVSRPRGYFLPLTIPVWAWLEHRFTWGESFISLPVASNDFGFLIVWTLGVVVVGWSMVSTWKRQPEPSAGFLLELVVPLAVLFLTVLDFSQDKFTELGGTAFIFVLTILVFHGNNLLDRLYEFPPWKRTLIVCTFSGSFGFSVGEYFEPFVGVAAGLALFGVLVAEGKMHDFEEASDEDSMSDG